MKQTEPRIALLSVYDKSGIVEFAESLVKLGWELYSSGGTAKALIAAGVPVKDVSALVGGGAILGHRVVTLSRELHAGLLARDTAEDQAELRRLGVPYIDLVCVDLYPLAAEIARPGSTPDSVIEQTDIGGPTMLRSAAKGRRIVVSRAADRADVLAWLKDGEPDGAAFRTKLAARAESVVAGYTLTSARYLSKGEHDGLVGDQILPAKYGENAWQTPAGLYSAHTGDPLAIDRFEIIAGAAPSYNNLAELDRHLQTITHIAAGYDQAFGEVPAIALGTKHGNPCGAGVASSRADAIKAMVTGDPRAIFGGLVSVNFEIDEEAAELLLTHGQESGRRLLDAVIAPSFTLEAVKHLSRKGDKCRFLANPALAFIGQDSLNPAAHLRPVRGGFLRQPGYHFIFDLTDPDIAATTPLNRNQQRDAVLAWAVGSTSNSNTITLVKGGQLIGNGVGQQDRVSCCELAVKRATDAHHDITGAVAYSDSFFPFPDGPQVLIDAGVSAIVATSGSVRDQDTIDLCKKAKVALIQLPDTKARGFFGH
jgi:phosphoribosylaminoimidazolecarboxamide formyltransferase/IMP cyclohydrolase